MPTEKKYSRRATHAHYRRMGGSSAARSINWVKVILAAVLLIGVITGAVFLLRACAGLGGKPPEASPDATETNAQATQSAPATPVPTPFQDGSSEERAMDLSQEAVFVSSSERNINKPGIYGDELVYSAGTGALDKPMLTKLFLFNLKTMEEERLTTVSVKDGEIYETYVNTDYIVWLDTDQQGTNVIYFMRRNDTRVTDGVMPAEQQEEFEPATALNVPSSSTFSANGTPSDATATDTNAATASPSAPPLVTPPEEESNIMIETQLKESGYHMPTLRLSGDRLVWNEQDSEKYEVLYVVDMISEEPVQLPFYTESIEGYETAYAISAPDIHRNEIVWAAPDPEDPSGHNSVIYSCDIEQLQFDDNYTPFVWKANTFVHDPMTNGKAWTWIDTFHEPVQNLHVRYIDRNTQQEVVVRVTESRLDSVLTDYCMGDDMIVYTKGGHVWVYFYETGMYYRVTADGETGKQPVAYGRRVAWFTDSVEGKDQLKVVYIP